MSSVARKSCSMSASTVLFPVLAILMASNCWLPALNVAVAHRLLHIMGKVCSCFVVVKKQ